MKKLLIITSYISYPEKINPTFFEGFDYIICADGGYIKAEAYGVKPDAIIGDFDSSPAINGENITVLPIEKDMTDTEAAIDMGYNMGARDITVLGGLGGRLDHTLGNIALLEKYVEKLEHMEFVDGQNKIYMLLPGYYTYHPDDYRFFSLVSYTEECTGITYTGFKYPLNNHTLPYSTTLGISNEMAEPTGTLEFKTGHLLVIRSRDIDND